MRRIEVDIPIVPVSFELIVFDDRHEVEKEFDIELEYFDAGVFEHGSKLKMVLDTTTCNPGIIVHECNHLLNFVFDYIGYRPDIKNDEMQCYFLQWIFNTVTGFYNSKQ